MHTWHISDATIHAYLRDFVEDRLRKVAAPPRVWCALGYSGLKMAQLALEMCPDIAGTVSVINFTCDRDSNEVAVRSGEEIPLEGKSVLLIDSSVHSGTTMKAVREYVISHGVAKTTSYALVLKRGSCFVPNFFGMLIDDHDRALFMLEKCPNNRMMDHGCVRKLSTADRDAPRVETGVEALDKWTWDDMLFEGYTEASRHTYVHEVGSRIVAYVSFLLSPHGTLKIDTLAVDAQMQNQGIGGHLLRWAETYARSASCRDVSLWARDDAREFYGRQHFKEATGHAFKLRGEVYQLMTRTLCYDDSHPSRE